MRQIALALVLTMASPVDAAAHCFSRWFYPWPQRCGLHQRFADARHGGENGTARGEAAIAPRPHRVATPDPDIPLPSLARTDLDGGAADDLARGRLLLRAILEAP